MSDPVDQHAPRVIVDTVQDAIVTDTDSPAVAAACFQLFAPRRAWLCSERD
jgi:hypothetical protein